MPRLFGLGPVFWVEARAAARRPRVYVARAVLVAALLTIPVTGLVAIGIQPPGGGGSPAWRMRWLGEASYSILVYVQVTVALLAAPAVAADALARDRARGVLGHLLVTDLSAAEIVVGTAVARSLPVLTLVLCAAPVAMAAVACFGTDPEAVLILEAVSLGVTLLGVAAGVGLSLRARSAYESLLGVYGLWSAWLLSWYLWNAFAPPPAWVAKANPFFLANAPYSRARFASAVDGGVFLAGTVILAAFILTVTTLRLRTATLREARRSAPARPGLFTRLGEAWRRFGDRLPGPTLDGNPVLWREWRHARRSRWRAIYWTLYAQGATACTALALRPFWNGRQVAHPDLIRVVGFESGLGLLAVAVGAASAWAEERAAGRGALDVLLATPMSAAKIVQGKWWASYRSVLWVAVLPAFAAVVLAAGAPTRPSVPLGAVPPVATVQLRMIDRVTVPMVVIGQVLVYGAAVVSLGLWLATRLARPTRAVMAAVVVFGMLTLVWPTAEEVFLIRRIDRNFSEGLAALSPMAGPIVTQMSMFNPWFGTARGVVPYAAGWLVIAALFAASLRWRTIRTFDRHMGRVEQQERGYVPPCHAANRAAQGVA